MSSYSTSVIRILRGADKSLTHSNKSGHWQTHAESFDTADVQRIVTL